jgi:hypothetical protein
VASDQLHTPAALPQLPTGYVARWAPEPAGRNGENRNMLPTADSKAQLHMMFYQCVLASTVKTYSKDGVLYSSLHVNSRDSSVGIVTKLRVGRPRNGGLIPDRDTRFISCPQL